MLHGSGRDRKDSKHLIYSDRGQRKSGQKFKKRKTSQRKREIDYREKERKRTILYLERERNFLLSKVGNN